MEHGPTFAIVVVTAVYKGGDAPDRFVGLPVSIAKALRPLVDRLEFPCPAYNGARSWRTPGQWGQIESTAVGMQSVDSIDLLGPGYGVAEANLLFAPRYEIG